MPRNFVTLFGIFTFFLLSSTAMANGSLVPTDRDQYKTHSYPIPLSEVQKIRDAMNRFTGYSPKNNILTVNRVRTGSGGGGGIACFDNDYDAEKAFDLGSRKIIASQVHLIKWLITYDATLYDEKTNQRFLRDDLTPAYSDETAMSYLDRILKKNIAKYNAGLAQRLRDIIFSKVNKEKWLMRSPLPVLNDNEEIDPKDPAGSSARNLVRNLFIKVNHPNCPSAWYVQLALRYQLIDSGETVLDADPYLLAVMRNTNAPYNPQSPLSATINEALLIMHEALYYGLMQKGFSSSYYVNFISGNLLTNNPTRLKTTVTELAKVL